MHKARQQASTLQICLFYHRPFAGADLLMCNLHFPMVLTLKMYSNNQQYYIFKVERGRTLKL